MSELVTDPNDPRLGRGADDKPVPQNAAYLVLSEEERAKGYVRPLRDTYVHVGRRPATPLVDLTPEQEARYKSVGYVKFEPNPDYPEKSGILGRYWTQQQVDKLKNPCNGVTTMRGMGLVETYARDPKFYGATYCTKCGMHKPVEEFIWQVDGTTVGS